MPRVHVIHWKPAEAGPLLGACRTTGFDIICPECDGMSAVRAVRSVLPDVILIDLSRLPSHGREVAVFLRRAKETRQVPIVFVGGEAEKVAAIRQLLPDAAYCNLAKVAATLKRQIKQTTHREFVKPPGIMERAQDKSSAQKLGIEAGAMVCVVEPPRDFPNILGDLPDEVDFEAKAAPVTLWFVDDREDLLASLGRMRSVAPHTRLWLLWRKGSVGGLTQNSLRELTREVGLVDYKICSVDSRWSAMLFAVKKA